MKSAYYLTIGKIESGVKKEFQPFRLDLNCPQPTLHKHSSKLIFAYFRIFLKGRAVQISKDIHVYRYSICIFFVQISILDKKYDTTICISKICVDMKKRQDIYICFNKVHKNQIFNVRERNNTFFALNFTQTLALRTKRNIRTFTETRITTIQWAGTCSLSGSTTSSTCHRTGSPFIPCSPVSIN